MADAAGAADAAEAEPSQPVADRQSWRHRRSSNPIRLAAQLWSAAEPSAAATAEEKLLQAYVRAPFILGRVLLAQGAYAGESIATCDVNPDVRDGVPIVVAHGAGAGLGFSYRNLDAIASLGGRRRRVLAFDWLGQACSSRPPFPPPRPGSWRPTWLLSQEERIEGAINFYVESLEAWRAALGIETFDLIAHSIGGYFSAFYAMAYPGRVRRLVLHGAVGIGPAPPPEERRPLGPFQGLWNQGFLHFGRLKHFGPLVRNTAKEGFKGYMATESEAEAELLCEYWWQLLCAQPLSSDTSVNICLTPIATDERTSMYGRRPVAEEGEARLANLARTRPAFVYGESDWLYGGDALRDFIDALPGASLHFVPGAAHHEYLDQYRRYHAVLEEVLGGEDAGRV